MAAAAFGKLLSSPEVSVTLIESEEIGTVGVGEATIPPIVQFNRMLGIDENEFLRETHATFKLGIEFVDWRRLGHRYMHPFGLFGADMNQISFIHFWLRWVAGGGDPDNRLFNTEALAAYAGRFARTAGPQPGSGPAINYAFQFDASAYAAFLRRLAERHGVVRREGRIARVHQGGETGFIEAVELAGGARIGGDLFIDCTGFRGLLIEETLQAGYEDWNRWLPANRAAAVPCARVGDPVPYTRATAREAGWQWRIPLQHRTGNGYVFCDAFISEDDAVGALMERLDGEPQADPRVLRFVTGKRRKSWVRNCVALGLSSGFLEPLESTSIHFIQVAITRLLALFPDRDFDPALANRFNDDMDRLLAGTRDFLVAHYQLTERDDTAFWRHCRAMQIPDTLAEKLQLFRERGEVLATGSDLFKDVSWFAILNGQGVVPDGYHPLADTMPDADLQRNLAAIRTKIQERVQALPPHGQFLEGCCGYAQSGTDQAHVPGRVTTRRR